MAKRITCINKDNGDHDNPHEAISHYGWTEDGTGASDKWTRPVMVDWVKRGGQAYVRDAQGNIAWCRVRTSSRGTEFLQTVADGTPSDNLLQLHECN